MTKHNNQLKEEEFFGELGPERNFAEDAKRIARNKRSQKGLIGFIKNRKRVFSSF